MCCQELAMGLGWSPGFSRPLSFVLLYAVFSRHLAGRTCSRRKTPFLLDVTMSSRPSPLKSVTTNWVPIRMAVPEPVSLCLHVTCAETQTNNLGVSLDAVSSVGNWYGKKTSDA